MRELAKVRLRTVGWLFIATTFFGLAPWWLRQRYEGEFMWEGTLGQWLGVWLLLNGLGLAGWCVNLFNVKGHGTPLPFDPPKRFVAAGPYRFVRNPMALGLFLVLGGEAALYQSKAVFLYLLLVILFMCLFVYFVEEPDLQRRFGPAYLAYKRQVPRWVPRPVSSESRGEPRQ